MLDYIIVRQNDVDEVRDTRAMRRADAMLRSGDDQEEAAKSNKSGSKPPCRLNTDSLKHQEAKKKEDNREGQNPGKVFRQL